MITLIAQLLHLPAIDAPLDARAALTEGYLVREDDVKAVAVQLRDAWDAHRSENEALRRERDMETRRADAEFSRADDSECRLADAERERDEARANWKTTETMRQDTALRLEECARQHAEEKRARLAAEANNAALREALEWALRNLRDGCAGTKDGERKWNTARAALAMQPGDALHSDDAAVMRFAVAMREKLARKRAEGRSGWDGPTCSREYLSHLLIEHVVKGDPLDVGNLAMMLHQRGERIDGDALRALVTRACEAQREADRSAFLSLLKQARSEVSGLKEYRPSLGVDVCENMTLRREHQAPLVVDDVLRKAGG